MTSSSLIPSAWRALAPLLCLGAACGALAQPALPAREYPAGTLLRLDQLPGGRLRAEIDQLPVMAQQRALQWLRSFHFTELDLDSLRCDPSGAVYYACGTLASATPVELETATVAHAAVPITPYPASLAFHSRPGAPNTLYLNFAGETVIGTEWNVLVDRAEIPALPFTMDSDATTFSDSEQLAIRRIWQRVAEDYAPFNIDVTTQRPATFTTRTAHALITRSADANGDPNPASTSGGVAYVNVFGLTSYAKYRPAWIYHNNLANAESYIGEASAHEVGHNLGLSHDGRTDGSEYYGGHGTGEISWGPVMGAAYNRNVTQWCKGDYYLSNNTQDDLATVAGKISYRTDDHGNTAGMATALVVTDGTYVVSTTPESDPANSNAANKGVLERSADTDVFAFVTGSGLVQLSVTPWVVPSALTRGGNLDLLIELYDAAGTRLADSNPPTQTSATIEAELPEGRYYLHVRNSGAGDPFAAAPTGYTPYASIGQYFISGLLVASSGLVIPPVAELEATDIRESGQGAKTFDVAYHDDVAINVSTLDSNDLRVTGPNGYDRPATFLCADAVSDGSPRVATYAAEPPDGELWSASDNGTYVVWMQPIQVADTEGAWVAAGQLGGFEVAVPAAIYTANMNVDPGWTFEGQWAYGLPAYPAGGPTGGSTGPNIIGYNLAGDYTSRLATKYATTPAIDCSRSTQCALRFRRWLRLRQNDRAVIEVSSDGTAWARVWSTSSTVSDSAWQEVQYTLPPGVAGSPAVRLRWGIGSNAAQTDIGWNIDDVELLGDKPVDTSPPVPSLSVADITIGGSPSHSCNVTYTDDTAVRLISLDSSDLTITGPNGYSSFVEYVGADLPDDGSPCSAAYSMPAPGGTWDALDDGVYSVILNADQVGDVYGNTVPETALGTFNVALAPEGTGVLEVSPTAGLSTSGPAGGPFSPLSATYTLTNTGETSLGWTASRTQSWTELSAAGGTLPAGASTTVTVSVGPAADSLDAGQYADSVSFVNTTHAVGSTSRPVTLTVLPLVELTVTVNNALWGAVSPGSGRYPAGSTVQLRASPQPYFTFIGWSGDAVGTDNPLDLVLDADFRAEASFAELLTAEHPTPYWWLAARGYTDDFEAAVVTIGANGIPLWQSYIAGLDPSDPESQFRFTGRPTQEGTAYLLRWSPVTDRLYTIWVSWGLLGEFTPLPGAVDLPWTIDSFVHEVGSGALPRLYRMGVRMP